MEKKFESKSIDLEELKKFFEKEDGVILSDEEVKEIAYFLRLLMDTVVNNILDE
ncbi:hypothetical protein ACV0BM_003290 [Elizabethkingia meningoseptica]